MSIDVAAIQNEFIRVAEQEVGSELATPTSVYKIRGNFPTSAYPYITFDILSEDDSDSWLLYETVDENDHINYLTNVRVLVQYTVKGKDSFSIASKLKSSFRKNRILDEINSNIGAKIEQVLGIISVPEKLSTSPLEAAGFNIIFNVNSVAIDSDPNGGVITRVSLDGDLKRDETDTSPLDVNVDVSSPDHT